MKLMVDVVEEKEARLIMKEDGGKAIFLMDNKLYIGTNDEIFWHKWSIQFKDTAEITLEELADRLEAKGLDS